MPKIMKLKTTWAAGPGHATKRAVTMQMVDNTALHFVVDVYDADALGILQDALLTVSKAEAIGSLACNYRHDMLRMIRHREGVLT